MDDLISRQDAIDAIEKMQMLIMRSMLVEDQFVFKGMSEALDVIKQLPSAELATNLFKTCNQLATDCISRQVAIAETEKYKIHSGIQNQSTWNECISTILETLRELPPAEPQERKIEWIPCSRELPKKNGTYIVKCERSGEQYYDMLDFDATMIAMKWNTTAKVLKWCEIPKEVDNEQT